MAGPSEDVSSTDATAVLGYLLCSWSNLRVVIKTGCSNLSTGYAVSSPDSFGDALPWPNKIHAQRTWLCLQIAQPLQNGSGLQQISFLQKLGTPRVPRRWLCPLQRGSPKGPLFFWGGAGFRTSSKLPAPSPPPKKKKSLVFARVTGQLVFSSWA